MKNTVFIVGSIFIGTSILFIPPILLQTYNLTKPLIMSTYGIGFMIGCFYPSIVEKFGEFCYKDRK